MGKQTLTDAVKHLFLTGRTTQSHFHTEQPESPAIRRHAVQSRLLLHSCVSSRKREGSRMRTHRIPVGREATKTRSYSLWIQTDNLSFCHQFFPHWATTIKWSWSSYKLAFLKPVVFFKHAELDCPATQEFCSLCTLRDINSNEYSSIPLPYITRCFYRCT